MPKAEYDGYRAAIADYLVSEQAALFGAEHMTKVLLRHVVDDTADRSPPNSLDGA
jgi:hypothetical protein